MKIKSCFLLMLFLASTSVFADSHDQTVLETTFDRIEVPVEIALAPAQGFDDNDNVQVVLYGKLPNACFGLDRYSVEEVKGKANVYKIRQFAVRRTDGVCANPNNLSEFMKFNIPFTSEISIGTLNAGQYRFQ